MTPVPVTPIKISLLNFGTPTASRSNFPRANFQKIFVLNSGALRQITNKFFLNTNFAQNPGLSPFAIPQDLCMSNLYQLLYYMPLAKNFHHSLVRNGFYLNEYIITLLYIIPRFLSRSLFINK
jgi:hypothetical protein